MSNDQLSAAKGHKKEELIYEVIGHCWTVGDASFTKLSISLFSNQGKMFPVKTIKLIDNLKIRKILERKRNVCLNS
jgi:hypothetical protein